MPFPPCCSGKPAKHQPREAEETKHQPSLQICDRDKCPILSRDFGVSEIKVRALKAIKITVFHSVKNRFICLLASNARFLAQTEEKCLICT